MDKLRRILVAVYVAKVSLVVTLTGLIVWIFVFKGLQ